jgi:protein-S-isoprenylcysteine O-methyltransferase Ste14
VTTASGGDNPGVHIPPPFFYIAAIGGGALLRRYAPLTIGWDAPRLIAAWAFVALFALLMAWSFLWFVRQKTTIIPNKPANALVLDGPFRFTRNPLYLAMALLTAGVGLWLDTWWVLILLVPAVVLVDRVVIAREEAYLRRRFGAEYDAFTARVRRWL